MNGKLDPSYRHPRNNFPKKQQIFCFSVNLCTNVNFYVTGALLIVTLTIECRISHQDLDWNFP